MVFAHLNSILNHKNIAAVLAVGLAVRAVLLILNINEHPAFFYQDSAAIESAYGDDRAPYLNDFGYEAANVAYSLVCREEGFANPFGGSTGPTGWVAPGIAYTYAAAFYLFGCFTAGSIIFLFSVSLILSAIIIYSTYALSLHIFNSQYTANLSALLIAFWPHDIALFYQHRHTDFNLITCLFVLLLVSFIVSYKTASRRQLLLFSFCAGVAVLFNPVFILPAGICFLFLICKKGLSRAMLRDITSAVLVMGFIIVPYTVYQNYRLGFWSFIKSNGPFELYIGNVPGVDGVLTLDAFSRYHPSRNITEFLTYKHSGELGYTSAKFNSFISSFNSAAFIKTTVKRFLKFFFIYAPVRDDVSGLWLILKYVAYAATGASCVIYFFLRRYDTGMFDWLLYLYMVSYALPFLCAGIMPRYSYPIVSISSILLGRSICLLVHRAGVAGSRHSGMTHGTFPR